MEKEFGEGHRPRHGTLGWLADLFYSGSEGEAAANLKEHLPDAAFGDRYVVGPSDAPRVLRTDAPESVGISYHSYNPPAIWGAGYSVMRVTFPPSVPTEFMSHAGEELLVPISGQVQYQFFWAPPGRAPGREKLARPATPFEMIRINPQIPHHTWSVEGSAEAWMIFRDVSEVPAAISLDPSLPTRGPVQLHPRTLSREDLLDPSRYALTAWGISERTRLHRERAGLGVQELAALADVDPAQLSRLEAGTRNLSLDALLRVARVLRIPLLDLIETSRWRFDRSGSVEVPEGERPTPVLGRPPGLRHWLHPTRIRLTDGWQGRIEPERRFSAGDFTTWIVLEGRLVLSRDDTAQGSLLSTGTVVHFRTDEPRTVETLDECRILQVTDSGNCTCLPAKEAPEA
ncbi:MAG: helix-turn-helix transcriptional regulator [Longimicrobiales bacterium]|nr:helix-turn-helix transcriptional regulator [Longimicrobiales bacterium]